MEKAEERRTLPRINADERGSGKVWPRIHGKPGQVNANEEIAKIAIIAGIAKIEKPSPIPVTSCHLRLTPLRSSVSSVVPYRGVVQQRWCMNFFLGIVSWSTCAKVRRLV